MWESITALGKNLYPPLFSEIFFKKTLAKVFVDVGKCYRNILPGKNFCFDEFTNRKGKNQYKNNQEEVKTQNVFPEEICSERYRICVIFSYCEIQYLLE